MSDMDAAKHPPVDAKPPIEEDLDKLGGLLERYRTRLGKNQREIADLTRERDGKGIGFQAISRLERGNRQHDGRRSQPHMHTLQLLADVLQLSSGEREEILRLAGYDPARVPHLPPGDLWNLSTGDLQRLAGRIDTILAYRRREQEP